MKIKGLFLTSLAILTLSVLCPGQINRGVRVTVRENNGQQRELKLYDGSYALIVGESDYTNGWEDLPGVKSDVPAVKAALEKHGFQVRILSDPSKSQLITGIQQFIDDYGYEFQNRLLIYFAGHGYTSTLADGRNVGYIVPVDAPLPPADKLGFERKAVDMRAIEAFAEQIRAKHALFIFDSCFSGKLVSRGDVNVPANIVEEVSLPVRQFITAGAASQQVPDESIFRKLFVRALEGAADEDKDGYILGSELAQYLKREVTNYSKRTQTPQYGKILNLDLNQGDFVFALGNKPPQQNLSDSTTSSGERLYWQEMEKRNTIAAYENYLAVYPKGEFVPLAKLKIEDLLEAAKSYYDEAEKLKGRFSYEQAIELYTKAINLNPKYELAYNNRGIVYSHKNEFDKAIADYSKMIELNPKSSTAYFNRCGVYLTKGNYDQALSDAKKLIELKPDYGFAYVFRGRAYNGKGQYDLAIADFSKALEIKNFFSMQDAYSNRGIAYLNKREFDLAITDFTKSLEQQINYSKYRDFNNRGKAYLAKREYNQAIADFTKAIELYPKFIEAYSNRASAYSAIGAENQAAADRLKAEQLKQEQK